MKKYLLFPVQGFLVFTIMVSASFAGNIKESPQRNDPKVYPYEEQWIEVMFSHESKVRLKDGKLTDLKTSALDGVDGILRNLGWYEWSRITDVLEEKVDSWEITGERNSGQDLYNLNNIYRLKIPQGLDIWGIAGMLEALPGICLARPVPKPMELPYPPPNYQSQQGYLNAATNVPSGVDALYAWTQSGGTGAGVTVCDLEYAWNYSHGDVTKAAGSQINTNVATPSGMNDDHGTAVIGELVANSNSLGTTGICYGSNLKTCGTYYGSPTPTWNVAGALAVAIANLSAGDVILLEQQWDYSYPANPPQGYYIPIEWWMTSNGGSQTYNAVYAAIVTAVANGIHVVEAGGNGNINTGSLNWYGNSGAIIVGAGGATTSNDRQRLSFSSYGPRFDLQGWGEGVYTTGYGTLYNTDGKNYWYTATFNGTSSASPIVAASIACLEGYYYANISTTPPSPSFIRSHLTATGTAQVFGPSGIIGPRPNIKAAIQGLTDFGDAPSPYPTLLANNGARHSSTGLKLGSNLDMEQDGFPGAMAMGDDLNNLDDEDGVFWMCNFVPGQISSIKVVASAAGYLNAWFDFNIDGDWADAGEQIFTNTLLAAGINNLTVSVPAGATTGNSYARFRFSTQTGLSYTGSSSSGEVEDHMMTIASATPMDYGDAPSPYPTLASSNGARHDVTGPPGIFLGSQIDLETDGQPDALAAGDIPDEDGVVFNSPLVPGQTAVLTFTLSVAGACLQGWIDFNGDGDWADASEQIMNLNPPGMVYQFTFMVPSGATPGKTYARFRYSSINTLSYDGCAPNGEVEDYMIYIGHYDLGDAPDPLYPTLLASNGAVHKISSLLLGTLIDPEGNGQPNAIATGDNINGIADEDGVIWLGLMNPGQTTPIQVTASGAGYLNGWVDFNINGSWNDAGEKVFSGTTLSPGINNLFISVPSGATPGNTFCRFRFSSVQALAFTGLAPDGEVEDYQVPIQAPPAWDFGDAPDPGYPTLQASGGACHSQSPFCMGAFVDYETDGQPDATATGDDTNPVGSNDDEDGVVFNTSLVPGQQAQVTIAVNMAGFLLQGWIDFTADGDWNDSGEQIFLDQVMTAPVMNLSFQVPANAGTGSTFARFRYSTVAGLGYTGTAPDGEVEDYQVYLGIPPTGFMVDPDPAKSWVQNEISMALLPGTQPGVPATLLAAYNDHPYPGGPGLGVSTSIDGGITWMQQQLPYPPDPFGGGFFLDAFDPTATADAPGNLYVAHISTDYNWATGPASGLFVNRSSDGGVTWNGPYIVAIDPPAISSPDPNFRFNDRCQITADVSPNSLFMNNLYLVEIKDRGWQMPLPLSDVYFTSSGTQGTSWTPQVILNGPQSTMANMPVPAVAPDGTIYVSWLDYNVQTGGIGTIYLDKSINGGITWLSNDILVGTINLPPLNLNGGTDVLAKGAPVIHTSPFNPLEVYITYAEQNSLTADEGDIMFIRSTDGGVTWSVPIRVNDDLTFNDQVMPWMDVKPNGTIDIAWYDRRNDPADLNWDIYMANSTDGGLTFGANQQLNTIPSAASPVTPSGKWMGEYPGLVVDQGYAYVTYTSSWSDIQGDIYFDKLPNPVTAKTLNLKLYLEGLYAGAGTMNKAQDQYGDRFSGNTADEIMVELHDAVTYATVYYTVTNVSLDTSGNISVSGIPGALGASYYVTVKHRNSIETTTAAPLSFAGNVIGYDFTSAASQAYGSNQQVTADGSYAFWGGDVNQDGIIDGTDMNFVDNAVTAVTFGYVPEDLNGDGIVDGTDMNMADNNSTAIIMAILPP